MANNYLLGRVKFLVSKIKMIEQMFYMEDQSIYDKLRFVLFYFVSRHKEVRGMFPRKEQGEERKEKDK